MQRLKTPVSKKTIDKESQTTNQSYLRHWDSWIVPDKFNLRDWYYLTQEENEDLDLLLLTEATTNDILDKCFISYVNKNVISYTLQRFQQDILNSILLIENYPKSLGNTKEITNTRDRFDSVEPVPSPIDAHSCGWPFPIYDPNFSETNINPNTCEEQIQTVQSQIQVDERSHPQSKTESYTGFSEINLFAKRLTSKSVASKSGPLNKKKELTVALMIRPKKTLKMSTDIQDDDDDYGYKINEGKKTRKAVLKKSDKSVEVPAMSMKKLESSKKRMKTTSIELLPKASVIIPKFHWKGERISPGSANFEFDHLEPSHFVLNRIKTGFTIKDVEVSKELTKPPPITRSSGIPKKGSEQTAKTAIVLNQSFDNILTMPSVIDKMTNLGSGVIVRKEGKPKIPNGSSPDQQEVRPLLKPITRSKVEPQLLISQIIDCKKPIISSQTTLDKK